MAYGSVLTALTSIVAILATALSTPVQAVERARITGLADANFGQLYALNDVSLAQSICIFSSAGRGSYSVVASGSGSGGAFELNSGAYSLDYQVQWAQSPNQASGAVLQAGVASPLFFSIATHQFCNNGPAATGTLIILLSGGDTANARSGTYSGVLSITIVPD